MYSFIYFLLLCMNTQLGTIVYLLFIKIIKEYYFKEDIYIIQNSLKKFKIKNNTINDYEILKFDNSYDINQYSYSFKLLLMMDNEHQFNHIKSKIFIFFNKLKETKFTNDLYKIFIQYGKNIISELTILEYYINNEKIKLILNNAPTDENINDKIEIIHISKKKITYMYNGFSTIIDKWINKYQYGCEEDIDTILSEICSFSDLSFIKLIYPIILTKNIKCQKYLLNQISSGTKKKFNLHLNLINLNNNSTT